MATITKADMVEYLHNELGLNKSDCKILIEDFFDEIKEALISGEEVKLSGFGNFELLNKNERPGRNPKTGKSISVSTKYHPYFRSSKSLRNAINN